MAAAGRAASTPTRWRCCGTYRVRCPRRWWRRARRRRCCTTCSGTRPSAPGRRRSSTPLLAGRDCVGVMPTGAGKSLTYQIPARILGGTTLVVSPLIALMKDQVDALDEVGLRATFLNSTLEPAERDRRVRALAAGAFEICLRRARGDRGLGRARAGGARPAPDRRRRGPLHQPVGPRLPARVPQPGRAQAAVRRRAAGRHPVLALTATATTEVTATSSASWRWTTPPASAAASSAPTCTCRRTARAKTATPAARGCAAAIVRLVEARRGQSGIVYALSRKACESLAEHLRERGIRAAAYHAGLEPRERTRDPGRVLARRRRRGGGDDRVRHGHRQVEHPLRHPPRHAAVDRGLLPGDRARRPRRRGERLRPVLFVGRRAGVRPLQRRRRPGGRGAPARPDARDVPAGGGQGAAGTGRSSVTWARPFGRAANRATCARAGTG